MAASSQSAPGGPAYHVYTLAPVAPYLKEKRSILHQLNRVMRHTSREGDEFAMSENGYISCIIESRMMQERTVCYMTSESEAFSVSEEFIRLLYVACEQMPYASLPTTPQGKKMPNPVPDGKILRRFGAYPVQNPYHGDVDHWLVKYHIDVPNGNGESSTIINACVEVRVRKNAYREEYIGIVIRWRPFLDRIRVPVWVREGHLEPVFPEEETAASDHDHAHTHLLIDPAMVYYLHDDGLPQQYLAPYEAYGDNPHHTFLFPASEYSLWIIHRSVLAGSSLNLEFLVLGGTGEYDADWEIAEYSGMEPVYSRSTAGGGAKRQMGNSVVVQYKNSLAEAGNYYVALSVRDRRTKAIFSKTIHVFHPGHGKGESHGDGHHH